MQELVSKGKRVRVVNRSGKVDVPAGVEVLAGDASDALVAVKLAQDAQVVYNCTNVPYTRWPELFPPLQQGIIAGVKAAGARLVAMENVYMYGPTGGKPLTEDLPYAATTRKGRTRARMAEELLAAHKRGDIRVAIGRASDFFGPGVLDSMLGERIFVPVLTGKAAQVIGNPDLRHSYTYMPDASPFEQTFGMHATPLREAIQATIEWFRQRGEVPPREQEKSKKMMGGSTRKT